MSLYQRMNKTASKLLGKYSQGDAFLIVQTEQEGANPWDDPVITNERIPLNITARGAQQRDTDGRVTLDDSHLVVADFGGVLSIGNIIEVDGKERQILRVNRVPDAGQIVCWHVFLKG